MPKFKVHGQHTVTTEYEVDANSMAEAIKLAEDDAAEPSGPETYLEGSFEVLHEVSGDLNEIKYAVVGYFSGEDTPSRQGPLRDTYQEALLAYLGDYPLRNELMEVLGLTMAVNGADAVPVWEEKFFFHVSDSAIEVRSIRDPRDPSDQ